jgi:hypothetical protein
MMLTQSQVDAALLRYDDLLAAASRARLITAATQLAPATTPRPVGRIRAGLRQAVASLVALAAIA